MQLNVRRELRLQEAVAMVQLRKKSTHKQKKVAIQLKVVQMVLKNILVLFVEKKDILQIIVPKQKIKKTQIN